MLCNFYKDANDNPLTRNRINKINDLLSQVNRLTDDELNDLAFQLLKLSFNYGIDLDGSENIVYKKVRGYKHEIRWINRNHIWDYFIRYK